MCSSKVALSSWIRRKKNSPPIIIVWSITIFPWLLLFTDYAYFCSNVLKIKISSANSLFVPILSLVLFLYPDPDFTFNIQNPDGKHYKVAAKFCRLYVKNEPFETKCHFNFVLNDFHFSILALSRGLQSTLFQYQAKDRAGG